MISHTRAHAPPYPPCGTEVPTGEGLGAREDRETGPVLIDLCSLTASKPVTRYMPRTREVLLIDRHRSDYRVDLDRIPDTASLLGWIEHLSAKQWVTTRHIVELIRHAEQHNGIKVNRGA